MGQWNFVAEESEATFEAVYEQLEKAVGQLEAGGLGLDESIALYERGMRLASRCKEMLDAAELRVSELEAQLSPRISEELDIEMEFDSSEDADE